MHAELVAGRLSFMHNIESEQADYSAGLAMPSINGGRHAAVGDVSYATDGPEGEGVSISLGRDAGRSLAVPVEVRKSPVGSDRCPLSPPDPDCAVTCPPLKTKLSRNA